MIKYIGSKRVLLPKILAAVNALTPSGTVLDVFSGTSRVSHALKKRGYRVVANDHNTYAYALARCYVQADRRRVLPEAARLIEELSRLPSRPGYFTSVFCEASRFFHPKNGARIDAIREEIANRQFDPDLEAVLLVSLMEAADRVDSTTGVQMAYLKQWAPRALNDLKLRVPDVVDGGGVAMQMEAAAAAALVSCDVAYLDPPYNQHSYLGNYHAWETLVRWDKPEYYGVACKRIDCKTYKSPFNSKRNIRRVLSEMLDALQARHLVVSYNNEGYLSRVEMEELLKRHGFVGVYAFDHARYVGAQIGIHNLDGKKVGRISHLRNVEYLYVVTPDAEALQRVERALRIMTEPQPSLF